MLAVEAQPIVSAVLTVNCLRNERWNVEVVNAVCSRRRGLTAVNIDYRKADNFGGVSFAERDRSWPARIASLFHRRRRGGPLIPMITLDDLTLDMPVSLLKIDIEGMELDALLGASGMLRECRPAVYVEQVDTARLAAIHRLLTRLGYRLYWLETHPFNQNNYRKHSENIWWRTETGILALSDDTPCAHELCEVRADDVAVPARLDARAGILLSE